jgi:hypothetical protein
VVVHIQEAMGKEESISSIQAQVKEGRCSRTRIQGDEDTMSKAQRLATRPNLGGGNSESFTSLSATSISSNMHNIGINFGANDNEVQLSFMSLKNIEIDRLSVFVNKRSKSKKWWFYEPSHIL